MIEITEHNVTVPYLQKASDGLRIAHLTDLHRSHLTSDHALRRAVAMANASRPDLIILTGDYVTKDPKDIAPSAHILSDLRAELGVFAVLGNHDYRTDGVAIERALTQSGISSARKKSVATVRSAATARAPYRARVRSCHRFSKPSSVMP